MRGPLNVKIPHTAVPINEEASTNFFFSPFMGFLNYRFFLNLPGDKVKLFMHTSWKACGRWKVCLHPSLTRALDGSGQFHVPAAIPLRKATQQLPTEYEAGCGSEAI